MNVQKYSRAFMLVAVFSFFIMWLYAASLPLLSQLIIDSAKNKTRINTTAIDWPHADQIWTIHDNINRSVQNLSLSVKTANSLRVLAWQHAARMRPLNPLAWLHLSQTYRAQNQYDKSVAVLNYAEKIGWNRTLFLRPIFWQYLILKRLGDAKRVARRLISIDLRETYVVYDLLSQFINFDEIIQDVMPEKSLEQRYSRGQKFSRWEYLYFGILRRAPAEKFIPTAQIIWRNANIKERQTLLNNVLAANLIQKKDYALLNRMLFDLGGKRISTQGDLDLDFSNSVNSLCWETKPLQGVNYLSDFLEGIKKSQLEVVFDNSWKTYFNHLSCYLPLSFARHQILVLNGSWSGEDFDPETTHPINIRVMIFNQNNHSARSSEVLSQTGDWQNQPLNLVIEVAPDDTALRVEFLMKKPKKISFDNNKRKFILHNIKLSDQSLIVP